ncbi:13328_t:CDS:2, partial [Acaulospora morrowiae]
MSKFLHETKSIFHKHGKTEPIHLVCMRSICIIICGSLLLTYLIFLAIMIATDNKPTLMTALVAKPYIPVPDHVSTEQDTTDCTSYILPTECSPEDESNRFTGRCTSQFLSTNSLNLSLPDKRYGLTFTFIRSPDHNDTSDTGMKIRAVDSLFNPARLPADIKSLITQINPWLFDELENLNFHIIGYHKVSKMLFTRKVKNLMKPNFLNVIGIPPSYLKQPYIESTFESAIIPYASQMFENATLGDIYATLFIGTYNWLEQVDTEIRSTNILDSIALLAGLYGLLTAIYICLFGVTAISPWGICQRGCCGRRSRENVYRKFAPRGLPILSQSRIRQPVIQRLDDLEEYIRLFLLNVSAIQDADSKPDDLEHKTIPKGHERPGKKSKRPSPPVSILNSAPYDKSNRTSKFSSSSDHEKTANVPPSDNDTSHPIDKLKSFFSPSGKSPELIQEKTPANLDFAHSPMAGTSDATSTLPVRTDTLLPLSPVSPSILLTEADKPESDQTSISSQSSSSQKILFAANEQPERELDIPKGVLNVSQNKEDTPMQSPSSQKVLLTTNEQPERELDVPKGVLNVPQNKEGAPLQSPSSQKVLTTNEQPERELNIPKMGVLNVPQNKEGTPLQSPSSQKVLTTKEQPERELNIPKMGVLNVPQNKEDTPLQSPSSQKVLPTKEQPERELNIPKMGVLNVPQNKEGTPLQSPSSQKVLTTNEQPERELNIPKMGVLN